MNWLILKTFKVKANEKQNESIWLEQQTLSEDNQKSKAEKENSWNSESDNLLLFSLKAISLIVIRERCFYVS